MSGDFLDSNVLLYLFAPESRAKQARAQALLRELMESHRGVISFQVVQEVLNVLVGKLAVPARPEDARLFLERVLMPLWRVWPSGDLYQRALDVRARYRFGFYDSLIVAAALEAGCDRLYSEDLQHGQKIESLVVEDPFHGVGAGR